MTKVDVTETLVPAEAAVEDCPDVRDIALNHASVSPLSECAEDERLSNGVRGACVSARAVTTRHSATRWAQNHVPLSKYSRISPCALLFLQVPTTVSSAP